MGAPWHTRTAAEVVAELCSDPIEGLAASEAARRLVEHGPNSLPAERTRSLGRMILAQLADPMIALLAAAALIAGVIGDPVDSVVIAVIVLLNAVIGVVQERRADQAMAALRAMSTPTAQVVREGEEQEVDAADLVPGDLVALEDGAMVPADLRLVRVVALRISEAALTGESQPVGKRIEPIEDPGAPVGDRRNMAYRGTYVVQGKGWGVVVETGPDTQLGAIAGLLASAEVVRTPLQRRLTRFGGVLAGAVLAICALVFVTGLLRGEDPALMLLTAISLAVAAVPEALPAVVAVSLALGARRMAQRHALVRRLPAVETLGSVTWVCSDKTGTLTENRMRAEVVDPVVSPEGGTAAERPLLDVMVLCNDAALTDEGATGDPTEIAMLEAARDRGVHLGKLRTLLPRTCEVPFDPARRLMATFHAMSDGETLVAVKGAPEAVLPLCRIPDEVAAGVLARADDLAASGLRVLAGASVRLEGFAIPADGTDPEVPGHLVLRGLVGLIDPPRADAADSVAECRGAGIVPVMITGDHPATAAAIARRLGILADGDAKVLSGPELARMSDQELADAVQEVRAYARMDPEQKIRIVRALQAHGQFVAMTGDGVNDAPALRQAEIGVAMGKDGTDVAREASDMVLLDDRFSTIVAAVAEGRRVYDDIRKFIRYALTGNAGEIWTIFLAPFLGMPIPLLPIHILWVNLVTDGLPGLALAEEPAERDVMARPPRPPQESLFAHGLGIHVMWVGLLIGVLTLGTQAWGLGAAPEQWQTMVFTVLVFAQLALSLAIRSETRSLLSLGLWSNPALLGAVGLSVVLQLALIYVPWLQGIFHTHALSPGQLAAVFVIPMTVLVAVELEKLLVRRGILGWRRR